MRFSVIIPLYNKAPYVAATIESVLAQTFSDFEVIVIDDGSNDGGDDIVAAIQDRRLRLIRQANAGVAAARNRGISLARGDWVAFLDADDWQHPRYLARQWETAAAYPQADAVATQFRIVRHVEHWQPQPWALPEGGVRVEVINDLAARWLTKPVVFYTCSIAVRASVLRSLQPCFPAGESYGEDLDLWFRLSERSAIVLAQVELVAYQADLPGSLASCAATHISEAPFLLRMERRALDSSIREGLRRSRLRLVDAHRTILARRAIEAKQRRAAVRLLWRARRAINTRRWLFTALMIGLAPAGLVKQWRSWRLRRGPNEWDGHRGISID